MLKLTQAELGLSCVIPSVTMSDVKRETLKDLKKKRNELHFGQKQRRSLAEENNFFKKLLFLFNH